MYERTDEHGTVFDFDEIASHLLDQGADVSPAQVHGCLSGVLAAGGEFQPELGLDRLLQALELTAHGDLAEQIMRLYSATAAALVDEEFGFYPLLPDDEVALEQRTAALAQWCSGFLAGFAQMRVDPANTDREWSTDAREILGDLAAISQAAVDDDESDDESEGSYLEIVEYLRFAVLNLFSEQNALADAEAAPTSPGETFH